MKTKLLAAAACALLATTAGPAAADIAILGETSSYTLAVADPAANLGSGPFGTILVTELNATTLQLNIDLNDPTYRFHNGNGTHPAFAFNLAGGGAISYAFMSPTLGNTGTGEFVDAGATTAPPFGNFGYSLDFVDFGGPPNPYGGPLVFNITRASGLDVSSFAANAYNGQSVYFASDLIGPGGFTGNVGAIRTPEPVPEPAAWMMMILGFGAVGAVMRRRRMALQRV
jgi:hypothetical protein